MQKKEAANLNSLFAVNQFALFSAIRKETIMNVEARTNGRMFPKTIFVESEICLFFIQPPIKSQRENFNFRFDFLCPFAMK